MHDMHSVDKPVDNSQEPVEDVPNHVERLQKFLAHAGVASRRHAEDIIVAGAVSVNGVIVTALGTRIDPTSDVVKVNGQVVTPPTSTITVAVYKPVGYVSTASDPQHRPILNDLLPPELQRQRLVPIGRLDADSEGLILLSNDGDLVLKLTHPRYEAEKEYHALLATAVTDEALQRLREGVVLAGEDPKPTAPAIVWRLGLADNTEPGQEWVGITIHEGRKRQIRMMFSAVGIRVMRLVRERIGQLELREIVPIPGAWHILTPAEIASMQRRDRDWKSREGKGI